VLRLPFRPPFDAEGLRQFFAARAVTGVETLGDDGYVRTLRLPHGGATVALAESAASIGTWLGIDRTAFSAVGLEINCNHLRAKRDGTVRLDASIRNSCVCSQIVIRKSSLQPEPSHVVLHVHAVAAVHP